MKVYFVYIFSIMVSFTSNITHDYIEHYMTNTDFVEINMLNSEMPSVLCNDAITC